MVESIEGRISGKELHDLVIFGRLLVFYPDCLDSCLPSCFEVFPAFWDIIGNILAGGNLEFPGLVVGNFMFLPGSILVGATVRVFN